MNNLTIKNYNGVNVTDSREVAEMTGKNHQHLMRDIRGYIKVLEDSPKLDSQDFFIETTYKNSQNKTQPCYLLTKQGCEMVANKMTGEKGVLFTAEYVQAFNKMEEQLKPQCIEDVLISSLKEMKAMREEVQAVKEVTAENKNEIKNIRDVVSMNSLDWKADCKSIIVKIAQRQNINYQDVYKEAYTELERRAGCQLNIRKVNKQKKMALEGVCKSKRNRVTKLEVIADDKRLTECFLAIVKEMAIRYGVA